MDIICGKGVAMAAGQVVNLMPWLYMEKSFKSICYTVRTMVMTKVNILTIVLKRFDRDIRKANWL